MKSKLHKMVSGYILSLNGDIDDPYAIVNEELAEDYGWRRLSLKNCQAIERDYDLDELANKSNGYLYYDSKKENKALAFDDGFKAGFQKAIEILGDKKFSEDDVRLMLVDMASFIATKELKDDWDLDVDNFFRKRDFFIDKQIQSLQQTEWDVEIVMEYVGECNGNNDEGCFQDSPGHNCGCFERRPKLDADGCLILKRI